MRRRVLKYALLAVTAAGITVVPGIPAHAGSPAVEGDTCAYSSMADPWSGGQVGEVDGGPIAVADTSDPAANPVRVTLTCTIQVGAANGTHAGADAASASASGIGAVVLPPSLVSYDYSDGQPIHLCTQVTVTDAHGDTQQLYLDGSTDFWESDRYSTDPTVPCWTAEVCLSIGPECDWKLRLIAFVSDLVFAGVVDPALCPHLAGLAPGVPGVVDVTPEGDVYLIEWGLFWDCPPYA